MGLTRLSLSLVLGTTLFAADPEPEPDKRKKATAVPSASVTVTAEATAVDVKKTPNPVKIVPLEVIERSTVADVAGLLEQILPGQLVRTGGAGGGASLFLNGTRSEDTVVTLDGLPIKDTSSSRADFAIIPMVGIERMEVLTGSCSVLAGANAMGGVVALYSNTPAAEGFHGSFKGGLGTQGVQRGSASVAQGWKAGWVRVSAEGHEEDIPTETRNPYRQAAGHVGAGLHLGENHTLAFNYRNAFIRRPLPYLSSSPTKPNAYDDTRESTARVQMSSLKLDGIFAEHYTYEVLAGGDSQHRLEVGTEKAPPSPYDSRRGVFQGSVRREATQGSLSLQLRSESEDARMNHWQGGQNAGASSRSSVSLEGSLTPLSWLRAVASVRTQSDRQEYTPKGEATRHMDRSRSVYKVGVNALWENGLRVYASTGTSYGLPDLSAVLYNITSAPGKPELQPEEGRSHLVGASWTTGPWTVALDLNRSMYDHLVYFNGNGWFYANGSDIRVQGAEARLDYAREGYQAGIFVRTQEARDLTVPEGQQLTQSTVVRRPFFSGGMQFALRHGAWGVQGRWTYSGSWYDLIPYPTVRSSGIHYNDVTLGASYDVSRTFSLTLRGEHLLQPKISKADWLAKKTDFQNDAYRAYNYPSAPRTVTLEARYRF